MKQIGIFIFKRLCFSIFVIVSLSILIFITARIVPGDPARMALGARAPEEVVQRLRQEMYLDKSLPEQYFYWIRGAFSGDFGHSLVTRRLVLGDIKEYLPATMELVIFTMILVVIFSISIGTLAARYKDSWWDNLIRIFSYVGVSIPAFVAAIILMLLFVYYWPILPVLGRLSPGMIYPKSITGLLTFDSLIQGNFLVFRDALKHLILPSVALSLGRIFQNIRITRSSMVENMRKEYLYAERGYGIPERVIMFKYLLKPSLIPVVSVMGMDFGRIFSQAFLVEMIFNWPGISRYGINAMLGKDLNAISAVIIIISVIFVVMNILVDIIVAFLDPRIRLKTNGGL